MPLGARSVPTLPKAQNPPNPPRKRRPPRGFSSVSPSRVGHRRPGAARPHCPRQRRGPRVRRRRRVPHRHGRTHAICDGVRALRVRRPALGPAPRPRPPPHPLRPRGPAPRSLLSLAADRCGVAPSPFVLGRARRFSHMWDLVRSSHRICPDAVTPRTVMVILGRVAKFCSVRETVASFRRLSRMFCGREGTEAADLFNALLRTLCQEKSMSDARNVYRALKYEFQVNRQTFNILLSGWKSAEDAEAFFAEMRELGVEPDQVTYNSLIDCHCKKWDVEKAYKLLDEMRVKDISPDVITYTSLIGGLGLIG